LDEPPDTPSRAIGEPTRIFGVAFLRIALIRQRGLPMKMIGTIFGVTLMSFPIAALAQAPAANAPDTGAIVAPKGHSQPRPTAPPTTPGHESAGVADKDEPAKLDQRLKESNDAAIRSICADCLKPLPKDQQP